MRAAAAAAGVQLVTGDTKVVEHGHGDGLFITTAGVGVCEHACVIAPSRVQPGDVLLVSGDLGRHGMAIMAVREGLAFDGCLHSDCAPLGGLVETLLAAGIDVHCLRDLTRGGLATALVEIAETAGVHSSVDESAIPVTEEVRGACELLGLDPLYVANEGRCIAYVAAADAPRALALWRACTLGAGAAVIGRVVEREAAGLVTMTSHIGARRIINRLSGEQLPRIC